MNRTWQSLTIIGLISGLLLTACGTADPTPRPREEQIAQLTQVAAAVSGTAAAHSATQTAQALPTMTPTSAPTPTARAATAAPTSTQVARPTATSTASGGRPASDSGSGTSATRVEPVTPTPRPVKSIPPGVLFDDDLTQPGQPWEQGSPPCEHTTDLICQDPGGLRARLAQSGKQYFPLRSSFPEQADMILDLDATVLATDPASLGGYGLMCRYQEDTFRSFVARVWADGHYGIFKLGLASDSRVGGSNQDISPAINQGPASNHITFSCIGTTLTLAVNGVELVRVTVDDPQRAVGVAALYACTCRGGSIDVVFTHVTTTIPAKSSSAETADQQRITALAAVPPTEIRRKYSAG
jgi:hypothetical protein